MNKICFYCDGQIDTKEDEFEKIGKKYVCAFCWEENPELWQEEDDEESSETED